MHIVGTFLFPVIVQQRDHGEHWFHNGILQMRMRKSAWLIVVVDLNLLPCHQLCFHIAAMGESRALIRCILFHGRDQHQINIL